MEITSDREWGSAKKFFFRFACIYIIIYVFSDAFTFIAGFNHIGQLLNSLGVWFGIQVLGIEGPINTNFTGSGDRTIDYINLLVFNLLAFTGSIIWSALDRHRKNYSELVYWIRLLVRYYLFAVLFNYGIVKVIKTQFPFPDLWRFLQPFGDASPMGLAWTYMGISSSYTFFAGLMELIPAVLLLFRKTTTLGALISAGVMVHVVVMNFSYDIPVKLFSIHIVLFSLFLVAPDGKRLLNIFLLNRQTPPAEIRKVFREKKHIYGVLILKVIFVASIVIPQTINTWNWYKQMENRPETVPLYGIWEVEEFTMNGETVLPLLTDERGWRYLIFEHPGRATLIRMNEDHIQYNVQVDSIDQTIALNRRNESKFFSFKETDSRLKLNGEAQDDSISVQLKKFDTDNFRLLSRGFNWVNEFPYNR